jgi:hypothetical protein
MNEGKKKYFKEEVTFDLEEANTKGNLDEDTPTDDNGAHKSFTDKLFRIGSSCDNIGDESLNTMVNTPMEIDSTAKKVSTLIMPLKRENYRNKIMPSEFEPSANDYVTPHKKATPLSSKK